MNKNSEKKKKKKREWKNRQVVLRIAAVVRHAIFNSLNGRVDTIAHGPGRAPTSALAVRQVQAKQANLWFRLGRHGLRRPQQKWPRGAIRAAHQRYAAERC